LTAFIALLRFISIVGSGVFYVSVDSRGCQIIENRLEDWQLFPTRLASQLNARLLCAPVNFSEIRINLRQVSVCRRSMRELSADINGKSQPVIARSNFSLSEASVSGFSIKWRQTEVCRTSWSGVVEVALRHLEMIKTGGTGSEPDPPIFGDFRSMK
jgi:hypothetical protein